MKNFLKQNGILILVIAVLLSLITAVVSFTLGGIADPFADLAGIISTPFRNGIHAFVSWTEERYSDAFARETMEEELEALRKENAQLKEQAREGEAASRENERLRNLLELKKKRRELQFESATVTARGSSNWSSTLTVNKGSADGIDAGDCVVDEYGNLVGVVRQVGLNWASVLTVVDVDLEMGGLISRTDKAAILEGDFSLMGQGKLKLTYLPEGVQLMAGDAILTSGLISGDKAIYPSRLLVGYVEEVRVDESGMNDYAVLTPAADLNSLEQVFIITEFDTVD